MADEIIIETTSAEVIEVGVVGPQGPQGLQGPPGEATASLPWTSITGKPSTFPPSTHQHVAADVTDFASAVAAVAPTPTWNTLTGKPSTFPPSSHTHASSEITGLGSAATSASTDFAAASHNHDASAITSGVFNNERINFASPSAIGAQSPNTGLFTNLSVASRLNLPSSGLHANDIWVSSGQVRYQAGSLITSTRTLLSAEDNLSNLDNTATARTNLGVGSSSAVTFGSIQNTPIGSTTPAAGSFTNLLASAELTVPAVTPASPSTGDLYRTTDMLRYRDSSNTERILLNNLDNLANLGNTATAKTNIGLGSANDVTFGSIQNTPIGSTTRNSGAFTTLSANNGTITASAPVLSLSQTWNNAATTFTGLQFDVTNTASATSSLVARLTVGSTNVFETDVRGFTTLRKVATSTDFVDIFTVRRGTTKVFGVRDDGSAQATGFSCSAGGDGASNMNSNGFGVRSSGSYSISSDSAAFSPDVFLRRDAAGVFAQYNGTNVQEYRLYGTFTSSTHYQRMTVKSARQTLSALSGASATTTGTFIPDGAVVVGVTTRVATLLTGATGYTIGDGTDADRWGDITGTAIGTTSDNRDWTAGTIECFTAGGNVTLTAKGSNFTAGAIEICVFYLAGEAD